MSERYMKKIDKVEHLVKNWEKKYCYLGIAESEREFFAPLLNKTFNLIFEGMNLPNRTYHERYKRIYLGRKVFKEIQAGDVLICYQDEKGNYIIERKK